MPLLTKIEWHASTGHSHWHATAKRMMSAQGTILDPAVVYYAVYLVTCSMLLFLIVQFG